MRMIGLAVVAHCQPRTCAARGRGAAGIGKVYRVGLIFTTSPVSEMAGLEPVHPSARAFVQGLRALGYVEGQNLILERRSAEGQFERFGDIVAELVRLKTDVIVAPGDLIPRAAMAITTTVPIVMVTSPIPWARDSFRASRVPAATSRGSCSPSGRRSRPSAWRSSERCCPECLASPTSAARRTRIGRALRARAFGGARRPSV